MNYTKPEVILSGSALVAIQGNDKGIQASDNDGSPFVLATPAAYEADE